MGLENRDYFRDGSSRQPRRLGLDTLTPVVKYVILANVAVFLLQIFITRTVPAQVPDDLDAEIERLHGEASKSRTANQKDRVEKDEAHREEEKEALRKARREMERMLSELPGTRVSVIQEWFELGPGKTIQQGQLSHFLTGAFCHARESVWHIVFNMLLLYWFGTRLETMYGSREFLLFYLVAAVCSSLAYVGLAFYTMSNVPAIGASGAVMGVMMLYTIYYPQETFLIFWVIPVPLWALLSLYVLYDLHPVLLALAGDRLFTGVAHAGHLGGLAFGYVYWRLGLRLEAPLDRSGHPARRPERQTQSVPKPTVALPPARHI